ncbi:MAG TPA: DUF4328 domain-containing protein [Pseudomonadales bacterium]|nr:DUF4328 domain-containing protein [Pseudomonadales bacterium]
MTNTENIYKSSSSLTRWVKYLLYAQILVAVVSIFSNYLEYQLLSDYQNGVYTSQEQAVADGETSDNRQHVLGIAYLLVFIISGFLILRWIHRANFNARQLGAQGMQFTPGWSIGYYFIPILTLWKPYQAMKEIWQASNNPNNWSSEKVSPIVGLWWFLWIISNMLGQAIFRMSNSAKEIPELMSLNIINQVSDVLDISLALVTLAVVNSIYKAQVYAYESANKSLKDVP